jgi:myo-inositol-hexaphosphate 3-phosphohydrolase
MKKVLEVVSVDLNILKSDPPMLSIVAFGKVTTGGWTDGQLVPYIYIAPPANGLYEFDFVATPPTGPATTVISPISASYVWENFPGDMKGVTIYASTNEVSEILDSAKQTQYR